MKIENMTREELISLIRKLKKNIKQIGFGIFFVEAFSFLVLLRILRFTLGGIVRILLKRYI